MPLTLNLPDIRTVLSKLDRRIGVLERRTRTSEPAAAGDGHDGAGDHAIAIAHSDDTATASGSLAVAVGYNAEASGSAAIALGTSAVANNTAGIAIGNGAEAANSIAVGSFASAAGGGAIAIGGSADASGNNAVALGPGTVASSGYVAIGNNATATHSDTIAIGGNSSASSQINFGTSRYMVIPAPSSAPGGSHLINGQITFHIDPVANTLVITAKYSGVTKTGTVTLT